MARTLEFWFEFASTYSYPAAMRIETACAAAGVPLVADMSSDFLWAPFDASRFHLIYAGAQKNVGPSGVTVVVIRKSWLEAANDRLPTMFKYATHAAKDSLYNTPPVFPIWVSRLVLDYLKTTEQASPEVQMKAETYINLGYQRLLSYGN